MAILGLYLDYTRGGTAKGTGYRGLHGQSGVVTLGIHGIMNRRRERENGGGNKNEHEHDCGSRVECEDENVEIS